MDDRHEGPPRAIRPPRRRSEKRRAGERVTFRLQPGERTQVEAHADAAQQSLGAYIRSRVLAKPITRGRRRPSVDYAMLSALLAELNKIGSNINQIARHMNMGNLPDVPEVREAQAEHRRLVQAVLDALGRGPGGEPRR